MSTSADLYESAAAFGRRADDCRETADQLERQAQPLYDVLGPILELHTSDTWSSIAADNSRRTLAWGHGAALDAIRRAIAAVVTELRSMAGAYEADERLLRRLGNDAAENERAAARDAAAAREAEAEATTPVPTTTGGGGGGGFTVY